MREEVPAVLAGERVDRFVAMVSGASRAAASAMIDEGLVTVDGTVVTRSSARLAEGAVVELPESGPAPAVGVAGEDDIAVVVVHADDDVIVVDKTPDLVVHPGAGNDHGTLVQGLLARYPDMAEVGDPERPGIVHRLDKGTSGLLVVARSDQAYESLVDQLADRTATREYLALVRGIPESPAGMVDAPIGRSRREPTRMTVSARGKEARTRYAVERSFQHPEALALVRCSLETGRTHQIRVHMAAIGHPVVGDQRYGGVRPDVPVGRPFLHATRLAFVHPGTGEPVAFESPLPADLTAVLATLS